MASKKENIKALFTNTRTRIIILFTAILLVASVTIGLFKMKTADQRMLNSVAKVRKVPTHIHSIPGSLEQTEQYATLQETQNIEQAEQAVKAGTSAIPTIIKTQAFGEGVDLIGPNYGEGGVGFTTLSRSDMGGPAKSLWLQELEKARCSNAAIKSVVDKGATVSDIHEACDCDRLRQYGFTLPELKPVCPCQELKVAGFTARELKSVGYSAEQLKRCGFSACDVHGAGFSAEEMKDAGYTDGELRGAGFSEQDIERASGLPEGMSMDEVRRAGCEASKLASLRQRGLTAAAVRRISGCTPAQLKPAGFTDEDLQKAGFTAAEIKAALSPTDATIAQDLEKNCSVENLKNARAKGTTAREIRETLGCSAAALKAAGYSAQALKDAGFTAAELKAAGFSADELKAAGFSAQALRNAGFTADELKAAGFSAADLRDAGFSAAELRAAGFSPRDLKSAGFSAKALKAAGFSAAELNNAGFNADELKAAGFDAKALKDAGFSATELKNIGFAPDELNKAGYASPTAASDKSASERAATTIPSIGIGPKTNKGIKSDTKQLQDLMARQQSHMTDQRYQAKVKQISGRMVSAANQALQNWKTVPTQVFIMGSEKEDEAEQSGLKLEGAAARNRGAGQSDDDMAEAHPGVFIKTGDIIFAVLDTAVNTDEPGPILATIVSGKLKGSKIIGSFTLPANADKMVLTFNTLSMQGADKTIGINAYAIDPNTARTALASRVNHHYLMRYGSLFASTFLAGFSTAIQSADTTITIGGTGGTTDTTVQNGINRSLLENALIGLGEVGKAWSQTAEQLMNRPTTVELFSGTAMGILFTQDVQIS